MILPSPTWHALMCHMRGYHIQAGTYRGVGPNCIDCGSPVVWTLPPTATTGVGRTTEHNDGGGSGE